MLRGRSGIYNPSGSKSSRKAGKTLPRRLCRFLRLFRREFRMLKIRPSKSTRQNRCLD